MESKPGPVIVTDSTRRAAVLGSPIAHSLSPLLHRAAYRSLGLDWTYDRIEMGEAGLADFLSDFRADESWVGLSLTMPLKDRARLLADDLSDTCRKSEAANTLIKRDGRVFADNTDPVGIEFALDRVGIDTLSGTRIAIIGAGATARSALLAIKDLGGDSVEVVARRPQARNEVQVFAHAQDLHCRALAWSDTHPLDHDLVISVVPAGAADEMVPRIPTKPLTLLDVVYSPWPSALTAAWQESGGVAADGLDMLVGQAARQVGLMTGMAPPIEDMLAAAATTRSIHR